MPNNDLPPVGSPEYYEMIRQEIINTARRAGLPLTDDGKFAADGQIQMPKFPEMGGSSSEEDPYAATAWGRPMEQALVCPSGQRCKVRRVDVVDLLGSGLLNNVDFLTSIVNDTHIPNAAKGARKPDPTNAALQALTQKPEAMREFQDAVSNVVMRVVVAPKLHPIPPEGEARVNGRVYIDTVSTTDKIHIFNWVVTGQEDADQLRQFREPAGESVGTVEHSEDVQPTTVNLPADQQWP